MRQPATGHKVHLGGAVGKITVISQWKIRVQGVYHHAGGAATNYTFYFDRPDFEQLQWCHKWNHWQAKGCKAELG